MKSFKTWNDFLNFDGNRKERIEILKKSNLTLNNPGNQRPMIWVALVDPVLSNDALDFFNRQKTGKFLSSEIFGRVKRDVAKVVNSFFETSDKSAKILNVLNVFLLRLPNFLYTIDLVQISIRLFTVFSLESDVFVILVHLYQEVYPQGFFSNSGGFLPRREETQLFSDFAKKLRPQILEDLSIKLKEKSSSKPSSEVFDFLMKSLADSWFTSLFSSTLLTSDFLRVFDCLLIQGFDFIILFALALLGKNQRFFRNSLKNEVKLIKTEKTLELLKVSATSAKLKLLQKLEKVPIEKLIKKCLNKPSYTSLFKLNIKPVFDDQLEIKTREKTLREARETIGPISRDTALIILNSLEIFENFSQITRSTFSDFFSKNFQWPGQKTIQFFSVFDQQGNDSLQVFSVKISLVLLVFGINNQLELMFKCSDQDNTGFISRVDLIKLVKTVEELLYFRSVFYSENCEKNLMNFEKIDLNQFKSLSKEEFLLPLFEKVFFLNENSPEKIELESPKNRFIEFNLSSPEKSPVLGFSENDVDTDEIPRLELDHLIEVIGENGVNVSVISFEKRKSQVKPAFVHLPQDFDTVEIVKDPEFLAGKCSGSEEFHEGKAWDHQINEDWERNEEEKKRMLESHKGFDILPDVQRVKERNGCSRLCSTQTCLLF